MESTWTLDVIDRLNSLTTDGLELLGDVINFLVIWAILSSPLYLLLLGCKVRRRQWQPTPVFLPGKCHGQRSLIGCSPSGHYELDTTKQLHFHFSLSCIGEGNVNPLQCSCLENPRDEGVWWAAVSGVAQSRTRLKRLSRCSSSSHHAWGRDGWIASPTQWT